MSPGTPAFIVEDLVLATPNTDLGKESKQQCPLCNEPKKLKDMRGHVGRHIMLHSRGITEERLVKTVNIRCLWLTTNTNPYPR